jgi:transcriptional regulator with XRE-family HTH domain
VLYVSQGCIDYRDQMENGMNADEGWLAGLRELHECGGLSYRELAARCDLDHSYVALILEGKRKPNRDLLTFLLAFGYRTDRIETDRILMIAGYPPLGRSARLEYRKNRGVPPDAMAAAART